MHIYRAKTQKLKGTRFKQVLKKAMTLNRSYTRRTKRTPYIRSKYFNREKIFTPIFWHHLHEKTSIKIKTERLKYFPCAVELIQKSTLHPISKENPNRTNELLHRFFGVTSKGEIFCVQIKEEKRSGKKLLISIFPYKKKKDL